VPEPGARSLGLPRLAAGARRIREILGGRERAAQHLALEHLAFLDDASVVLSTSLDPDLVVDLIASLAVPRLGDGALVFLRDEDSAWLASVVHQNRSIEAFLRAMLRAAPPTLADRHPPGQVLRTGQTWYLPYVTREIAARMFPDEVIRRRFEDLKIGSALTVPIPGQGRIMGALTLVRSTGTVSSTDISLAEHLARRGAAALDNAQRYRGQRESALTLQRSLLPANPPSVEGVEIAMEYRPGAAGTEVGGDLYDVIPLPGGRVGVAIGDVMGHGLRAAAVMGQLRAALRAYALEEWNPAELLTRLDRVVELLPGLHLATCLYLVYDPATNRAVVSNAGHLPPLLVMPDEEPDYLLLEPGLPLGVGEGTSYSETSFGLPPGSAIVLYTDGLVESRGRTLSEGLDRLRIDLGPPPERDSGAGPGGTASHGYARDLLERCLRAAGLPARADDDTALLVMTTHPSSPPLLELALPAEPRSAGRARLALTAALAGEPGAPVGEAADDAVLLVSEVVTNAVTHARSDLVLRAQLDAGSLRVSVEDHEGDSLPARRDGTDGIDSGWGLNLVDSLSRAWGVETTDKGKIVWFDLAVPEPVP
jgi:anti-sigma regulatory factor (Ser/Thr protein kinase)